MSLLRSFILAFCCAVFFASASFRQTMPETAQQSLSARQMQSSPSGGGSRGALPSAQQKRTVGMFYFLWQGGAGDGKTAPYNISRILAANPNAPVWGPRHAFHFWGEPQFGYYAIEDPWILRKHAQMLSDAGVDVVILDATNAFTYPEAYLELCRVYTEMRREGNRTPQIAFILHSSEGATAAKLFGEFYGKNLYADLWFRWQGKPLLLCDPKALTPELQDFFTVRQSWAWSDAKGWFGNGRDKWPWLDNWPQQAGWHDAPNVPEEVAAGVAGHPTTNIGRSNHDGKQPADDKLQSDQGLYFAQQWERARAIDPQFVFVTGWNEWIAQRFVAGPDGYPGFLGKPTKEGESYFVDEYSPEYSRDLEPMQGGWGDGYYRRLVEEVQRFKGIAPAPKASAPRTMSVKEPFTQWATVGPTYRDDVGDTAHRDFHGFGGWGRYVNTSGRNDIAEAKVARDKDTVAFYVRTKEALTAPEVASDWMTLLLDTDGGGWQGFRFAVRQALWQGKLRTVLCRCDKERWVAVAPVAARWAGSEMQVIVPRRLIGSSASRPLRFGFKWIDHCPIVGDGTAFLDQGDAAPNARFRYRFAE